MNSPFLSICIPSFNRPRQLGELLASIDCSPTDIEIVICEDLAPKRLAVRAIVNGGAIGLDDVAERYRVAMAALGGA